MCNYIYVHVFKNNSLIHIFAVRIMDDLVTSGLLETSEKLCHSMHYPGEDIRIVRLYRRPLR